MFSFLFQVLEHQYSYGAATFKVEEFLPLRVPTSEAAVTAYKFQGGSLTVFPSFGVDPLGDVAALQALREERFNNVTDLQNVFGYIVNANCHSFENAILTYANITRQLLD